MQIQLFVLTEELSKEKMKPIKNNNFIKPLGGLWTSTYNSIFGSDWVQYSLKTGGILVPETDYWNGYLLIPKSDIKLYEVNSYEDLEWLVNKYKIKVKLKNYSLYAPRIDETIDFEKMQSHWDGIHLTKQGVIETKKSYPYNLDGWDVESTIWFRWMFANVIKMKREFISKNEFEKVSL